MPDKPVGLTKNVGFQAGARRTFAIMHKTAWQIINSAAALKIWLGELDSLDNGEKYQLADGTTGEVRVFKADSHLRLTWRPKSWAKASTIQVRVITNGAKSVISFHQENLPNAEARKKRLAFFNNALDELENLISSQN